MTRAGSRVNVPIFWTVVVLILTVGFGALAGVVELQSENGGLASIVRGGRLYDNWFEELAESDPVLRHPSYPATGKAIKTPAETWRCKECHGWDYRGRDGAFGKGAHFTGIIGIRGMAGAVPDQIIPILKDDTHRYGELMGEEEFRDLANFVSKGQVDMDRLIDRTTKIGKGDAGANKVFFETICANCHGREGQKFRHMPTLGRITSKNPWEALHKILNGHPGETMPALRAFGEDILVGILTYTQTLPQEDTLSSIVQGGRLYDNWYLATRKMKPRKPHPEYPATGKMAGDGITWRCKECHGWDYRGRDGAYAKGPHYTGIKGIRRAAGLDPERIIDILDDRQHGYDTILGDQELRDLANFVSKGQVDMDRYIDRKTNLVKGNADRNIAFYTTICATCHGLDGREISTMPPLGRTAVNNPWNALHVMLNGHPAEEMPALRALEMDVLVDILAYIQTLATK
ncbi:MAG: hypothetical protein ISR51_01525 [Rhodospirillales bacterium]|nr:hypothetical protein [Alphaproteobacteria bacterium]MBL6947330.1 hypothetical protein [Rhodospirillales bacterium]